MHRISLERWLIIMSFVFISPPPQSPPCDVRWRRGNGRSCSSHDLKLLCVQSVLTRFLFDRKSWKQRWSDPKWSKAICPRASLNAEWSDNQMNGDGGGGGSSFSFQTLSVLNHRYCNTIVCAKKNDMCVSNVWVLVGGWNWCTLVHIWQKVGLYSGAPVGKYIFKRCVVSGLSKKNDQNFPPPTSRSSDLHEGLGGCPKVSWWSD